MTTRECPKATMVEALRDGRLGPQELASMERHVAVCIACTRLTDDLERISDSLREPIDPATPLEHQRARFALLRRATTPVGRLDTLGTHVAVDRPARISSALAALWTPGRSRFALAASFAVFAFVVGWVARSVAPSDNAVASSSARGLEMKAALGQDVILRSSSDAHFERSHQAGLDVVKLEDGALDLTLPPRTGGDRFVVRTRDAEIEVRATAFHVEAQQGRIRGVAVVEGSIEVRYAGFSAVITTGGSWRATDDVVAPPAPKEVAAVDEGAHASRPFASGGAAATGPAMTTSTIAAARTTPIARIAAPTAAPPQPMAARSLPSPRDASTTTAAPPNAVASAAHPEPSAASRDFAAAMRSLGRGDYDRAADLLSAFSAAHPGDARTDEADYLRAIALQRRGQLSEAAAIAKRYLATRANGAHRAEATLLASE